MSRSRKVRSSARPKAARKPARERGAAGALDSCSGTWGGRRQPNRPVAAHPVDALGHLGKALLDSADKTDLADGLTGAPAVAGPGASGGQRQRTAGVRPVAGRSDRECRVCGPGDGRRRADDSHGLPMLEPVGYALRTLQVFVPEMEK
jgi:hypothetical protein